MSHAHQIRGARGEDLAEYHLESVGAIVVDRNWHCRDGEIDLVARDGDTLVFCEVKLRTGRGFGDPLEAVTAAKVARLRRLAARWLSQHPDHRAPAIRLDAIGVYAPPGRTPQVHHVRGIDR